MVLKTPEPGGSGAAGDDQILVPGSVANLGGGFDTLGVAVQLYLRLRILGVRDDGGSRLVVVRSEPPVQGANAVERAFSLAARRAGKRTPTVEVEVSSAIPMAAGLGSSAAATAAGLRVFERVAGSLADDELLAAATEAEGHADNAAPALFGGLNSVVQAEGGVAFALRWSWPEDLQLVVGTPQAGLSTATARAALPALVQRTDAVFNLQRVLALVHALQHQEYDRLREAVRDRLHQSPRADLVPALRDVLSLEDPDVLAAFLSGAGPSVALLVRRGATRVEGLLASIYDHVGVPATVRTLSIDEHGSRDGSRAPEKGSQEPVMRRAV